MNGRGARTDLRPRRVPGTRLGHDGGRALISDADGSIVVSLNESAAAVWELCDGETTIDEMVMAICELASIQPHRAREDVETTLAQLERAGVVAFRGDRD